MRITKLAALLDRLNDHLQGSIQREVFEAKNYYQELSEGLHAVLGAESLVLDSGLRLLMQKGFDDVIFPIQEMESLQAVCTILKRQFQQAIPIRPPTKPEGFLHWLGPLSPGRSKPWAILLVRLTADAKEENIHVMDALCQYISTHLHLIHTRISEDHFELEFVHTLGQILESRSKFLFKHCQRVEATCQILGRMLNLQAGDLDLLGKAARIHDIGMVHVPDEILKKAGLLTPSERTLVQKAVSESYRFLQSREFFDLEAMGRVIYCHYERMDGSGYPRGLIGDQIPKAARILAVANAWDAMTTARPYQSTLGAENAMEELKRSAGMNFDRNRTRRPESQELFDRDVVSAWLDHIARSLHDG